MPSLSGHQRPNRGASHEWYTPPEIFDALRIRFDLDPCSPCPPVPWIPCNRFFSLPEHNGLTEEWEGRVWLNPPYGPEVGRWLDKLLGHVDGGGSGVALVPARTDTRWFHDYGALASAVCFLKGRPHFYRPDLTRAPYNSGAPIILLGYGPVCSDAVMSCGLGLAVDLVFSQIFEEAS